MEHPISARRHGTSPRVRSLSGLFKVVPFVAPFLRYVFAGRVTPLLAGYKITHRCNLTCVHCPYWKRSGPEQDFQGVLATLRTLAGMGVRILILEGGEPLLWRDGRKSLEHVIEAAAQLFPCVCLTTNGTIAWGHLPVDRVWVSLDGTREVHDSVRGAGVFDRVWDNLGKEGAGRAFISSSIGTHNVESIPEMVASLKGRVAGITIQFYYPYQGLPDPLFLTRDARNTLLDHLIELKREGYPVANSVLSLRDLKNDRWICEDGFLANAEPDGSVFHGCYLKNRGPSVCRLCGFSAHNEMSLAFKGNLEAVLTGLKIFFP